MRLLALAGAVLILAPGGGAAQSAFVGVAPPTEVIVGEPEHTYGTASLTVFTVPSTTFTVRQASTTYSTFQGIERFLPSGGLLDAGAMLPNGSQIERLELRACDTSPTAQVNVTLGACVNNGSNCTFVVSASSGVAPTPGCSNFSTTLTTPLIVNNQTTPLLLEVDTGTTSNTTFSAVKLYYRLRVSPAPATATFVDVPTSSPFFRFVEALVAAGVTGGCGGGAYCPDAPITRGQMAVFLATSLGLHFPN